MIHRIYVEKRENFNNKADALCRELKNLLNIKNLEKLKILERYDIEGINEKELERCKNTVFADPCTDIIVEEIEKIDLNADRTLAVEYLPGQYDQRADAASQCISLLLECERPNIKTAKIYLFYGEISDNEFNLIKKHLINPVECREVLLTKIPETLSLNSPAPDDVIILEKFIKFDNDELKNLIKKYGLAMSLEDLLCCQDYFKNSERRDPTLTEIKVLDTYWSDHCRHTTFLTHIDNFECDDKKINAAYQRYLKLRDELKRSDKPKTLMDMATIGAKILKSRGKLQDLVESDEINACTVRIKVNDEPWLLLFKNETHNHPTEIEPFGGAATCIGGAIRDPLSGRGYVYQAMRLTGAADPRTPLEKTLPGKLPQRTIVTSAAEGYSSYGNQIGIPTGIVDEIYHDGYVAKRMEVGAVIAAVPESNVRRERPSFINRDCVLLIGGRTGRDGCGGATGSSRAHNLNSLDTCGAEVQKGNAPEERKLQRLFRNPEFSRLIKRCNDFGAGGVSVAVGELADGLKINLDAVPLKYSGLDGTEIAISESQERMAVVVSKDDAALAVKLAESEDIAASFVAEVTNDNSNNSDNSNNRMIMTWRGKVIVNLSRDFIASNGAERHINIKIKNKNFIAENERNEKINSFAEKLKNVLADLNVCSKRGLAERFDSSVGANSVLIPFGGARQRTPTQAMAAKIPVLNGETDTCSLMAWGFDPFISSKSQYDGAYLAVIESICKLAATGADLNKCWLSFQEYFGRPDNNPERWGFTAAALLGALDAQIDLEIAAIGGKDSMSGTFELEGKRLDVPPTLISFAVAIGSAKDIISPEFKRAGSRVILLSPVFNEKIPEKNSMRELLKFVSNLILDKKALAASTPVFGGAAAMIFKMCIGNNLGFEFLNLNLDLFNNSRGTFIIELDSECEINLPENINCAELGRTIKNPEILYNGEILKLSELEEIYDNVLENIYPMKIKVKAPEDGKDNKINKIIINNLNLTQHECHILSAPVIKSSRPKFIIPVFPGTNCEYESAKAVNSAGGEAEIFVIKTLTPEAMKSSAKEFASKLDQSQALFLPGGFSNGDEPDGSGKFIAIFLRSPVIRDAVQRLLDERGGLICGICNGFQALVKTGLLPFGRIVDVNTKELNENSAALTFNTIGRHQAKLIRSKIIANNSPWLNNSKIGDVYIMPISHGEGRFTCGDAMLKKLFKNGQVAAQYVDMDNNATMDVQYNPSGSLAAIECLTSPDGRILGRMGHAERIFSGLYKNSGFENINDTGMFKSAVKFFK